MERLRRLHWNERTVPPERARRLTGIRMRKELYAKEKKTFNYNACSKELTALKKNLEWLKEVDSTALQSSLKDLETAYKNFFRRVRNLSLIHI